MKYHLPRGEENRCSTLETTEYIFCPCPSGVALATDPSERARACAARRNYFAIYYPSRDVDLKQPRIYCTRRRDETPGGTVSCSSSRKTYAGCRSYNRTLRVPRRIRHAHVYDTHGPSVSFRRNCLRYFKQLISPVVSFPRVRLSARARLAEKIRPPGGKNGASRLHRRCRRRS